MKCAFKNKWLIFVLLIWAVIFCVPALRYHLQTWCEGSPWMRFTIFPNHYSDEHFSSNSPELPLQVVAAKDAPPFVWIHGNLLNNGFNTLDKMDQFIHQNPNLPWLIALRLHITMGTFDGNRCGGEWDDLKLDEHLKTHTPSPEKSDTKVNFTSKQLNQALSLCRLGEKLEPQNSYFSWMRCYFLLLDWQDKEAWQALDEAAAKTYWNDHNADFQNLYARSAATSLHRPLLPWEKIFIQLDTSSYDPDHAIGARLHEMLRVIGWEGVKLNRQGKHAEALQIWSNLYRVIMLDAQGETDGINFTMDHFMLVTAARGAIYPSLAAMQTGHDKRYTANEIINGFIAFAKKYQRPDLANQIEEDWKENYGIYLRTNSFIEKNDIQESSERLFLLQSSNLLSVISIVLIFSSLGGICTWLLLACYRCLLCSEDQVVPEKEPASWWEKVKGVAACSGLPSFAGGLICVYVLVSLITVPPDQQYDLIGGWGLFYHASDTNIINGLLDGIGSISSGYTMLLLWRLFAFLSPFVLGGIYVLYKRSETTGQKSIWSKWRKILFLSLLFSAWGVLTLTTKYNWPQVIVSLTACAFLIISFIFMYRKAKRIHNSYALHLFQSSIIGWTCTASILILAALIGQTVSDNHLQPWADMQLRGEIYQIHHVIDAPPLNH